MLASCGSARALGGLYGGGRVRALRGLGADAIVTTGGCGAGTSLVTPACSTTPQCMTSDQLMHANMLCDSPPSMPPGILPMKCNTAGGYVLSQPSCYMLPQCLRPEDLAAANAQCAAPPSWSSNPVIPTPTPATLPATTPAVTTQTPATPPSMTASGTIVPSSIGAPATTSTASTDIMLGSFDVSSFLSNYGLYLAIGVGALLILPKLTK
jgi:hypothetical protein